MQAIVQNAYGAPRDVLRLQEIDVPRVVDNDVLVRVHAASLHPDIWHVVTGRPRILRLMGAGLFAPKDPVPGTDLSGIVESVGSSVTRFHPGDAVFGESQTRMQWRSGGAFAQFTAVPQDALALKPAGVTSEEAAAVSTAGYIALLNLPSRGKWDSDQNILINGAGGSVGSIALQVAKARGARVTGVDCAEKLDMMRALGADRVIDYAREDFTQGTQRYDLIFDVASTLSFKACKKVLTPRGIYIIIGHDHFGERAGRTFGSLPRMLALQLRGVFDDSLARPGGALPKRSEIMSELEELLAAGKLTPIIHRTYPLSGLVDAMDDMERGCSIGRILITPWE